MGRTNARKRKEKKTMNAGYSLRQAAKLSGVPTMTFHAWKEKRLVTPDVADNKGNISLFSETMIERAKEIDKQRKAKKSVDNSGNLFEEPALVATVTNGEVEPLEKEKVDDTDAKEVIEVPAPVETAETATTIDIAPAAETVTLEERANRIRQLQADVQRGIIAIGFELIAAKKEIGHGGWADWLKNNFDWTQQTANRFMRVSERFGKLNNVVQFKPSTLQAMLALPEGDENAFIEAQTDKGKPVDDLSAREVQSAVKEWNQQRNSADTEKRSSFEESEKQGKIAAIVTPCVEKKSISEDIPPVSTTVSQDNAASLPALYEKILPPDVCSAIHKAISEATVDDIESLKNLHDALLKLAQELGELIITTEIKIGELLKDNVGDDDGSKPL